MQRQTLYSKQGRAGQFASKAQRDEWIRKEMNDIQQSYNMQTSQAELTARDLKGLKTQLAQTSQNVQAVRDQEAARRAEGESLLEELTALKVERDQLTDQRK